MPRSFPGTAETTHQILFELGRGGMGTVYLAYTHGHAGFAKLNVIKQLRYDLSDNPHFLEMFMEEAKIAGRLDHPNIVQTHGIGYDGRHYFIEMEYLEGESLGSLLARAGAHRSSLLPHVLRILAQTLAGLHYAHEMRDHDGAELGIVHRDVSPHNILVTYEGAVKLVDFGIAKAHDSSVETATGVVKGKITYMAPEQARRATCDRRADIFSVGVILWEVLAQRRLYQGHNDLEALAVLSAPEEFPRPREVNPAVPEALDALCARAIAKDRAKRFDTAAEFQVALEEVLLEHPRVGSRQLIELMTDLFGDRRAATRRQIDACIHDVVGEGPVSATRSSAPPLASRSGTLTTAVSTLLSSEPSARPEPIGEAPTRADLTHDRRPATAEGRRRWPALSGLLLAGAACAAGFLAWASARDRRDVQTVPVARSGGCATAAECVSAHGGAPYVCSRSTHACVSIDSPDCHANVAPSDLLRDDTLWVGVMFPYREGTNSLQRETRAVELAQADFVRATRGIPRTGGRAPRPLGTIMCDDSTDAERASRHLVEDIGVPAVIGFWTSAEAVDLANRVFLPHRVLVVDSRNVTPLLASLTMPTDSPRLVWRTTVNSMRFADLAARLLSNVLEPSILAHDTRGGRPGPLRLAIIADPSPATVAFNEYLSHELVLNGTSAAAEGDNLRTFVVGASDLGEEKGRYTLDSVASELLAFRPHIVLLDYLNRDIVETVLARVEAEWPRDVLRPEYISLQSLDRPELDGFVGGDAGLRRRLHGMEIVSSTPTAERFVAHYNEAYGDHRTLATAPATSYDAFYVIAFAAAALGDDPITGTALARAIPRLTSGETKVSVGPDGIADIAAQLGVGRSVDLEGASGGLAFDPATGDAPVDLHVDCLGVDAHGRAAGPVESGLWFDGEARKVEGKLGCP
jgi:serine/threonine-protein kinase